MERTSPGNSYRFNIGSNADGTNGPFGQGAYRRASEIRDGLSSTVGLSEKRLGSGSNLFAPNRDLMYLQTERSINPPWPTEDEWLIDCSRMPVGAKWFTEVGRAWLIDGGALTTYNHVAGPNATTVDCARHMGGPYTVGAVSPRSWHPGAVVVGFMDGRVRTMTSSVDLVVWRALGSAAGDEHVTGEF